MKEIVVPGELLGEGISGFGTYKENNEVYSKTVGILNKRDNEYRVVPLNGAYVPRKGDGIIAIVSDITFSMWILDINSPYTAILSLSEGVDGFVDLTKTDLTKYFNYGDVLFAKVSNVTKSKSIHLSMRDRLCRKLVGGRLVKVTPTKVPRVIGKTGSMVEMIKKKTGTQIVVGQNGVIWIKGENQGIATRAILEIEKYSHIEGLTDKISKFIDEQLKR